MHRDWGVGCELYSVGEGHLESSDGRQLLDLLPSEAARSGPQVGSILQTFRNVSEWVWS